MPRTHRLAALTIAAATLLLPAMNVAVVACPMCKDSIPGAEAATGDPSQMSGGALPGGFNTSVYLMLAGFLGTLGLVGWTLVKGVRDGGPRPPGGFPVVRDRKARGKAHDDDAGPDDQPRA